MTRANKFTAVNITPTYYSDFLMDLDKNPLTGAVAVATNEESVKNALKNLILTNRGERFYNVSFGSKIRGMLFENYTSESKTLVQELIREAVNNNEPRVNIQGIEIIDDQDRNGVYINIVFTLINIPRNFSLNLYVSRVR